MQNDNNIKDDLRLAWRSQTEKPVIMSEQQLQRRAYRLQARIRWRNIGEYSASVLIGALSAYFFLHFQTVLLRAGATLIAAGVAYVTWQLARHGSAGNLPSDTLVASSLDFLITQLERQRDLLRRIWNWYLLPLLPGLIVFVFGLSRLPSSRGIGFELSQSTIVHTAVACVVGFALIAALNQSVARKLQREIEFLSSLRKGEMADRLHR